MAGEEPVNQMDGNSLQQLEIAGDGSDIVEAFAAAVERADTRKPRGDKTTRRQTGQGPRFFPTPPNILSVMSMIFIDDKWHHQSVGATKPRRRTL